MLGEHLLELAAELVAVGDAEENILDLFVGDDGIEHRVERAAFRTVEAEFGRALARHIDDQLRGVRAQCALVEEGQQRLRSGQLVCSGQRSSGTPAMLTFNPLAAPNPELALPL